jgi:hypothetical protein
LAPTTQIEDVKPASPLPPQPFGHSVRSTRWNTTWVPSGEKSAFVS